MTMTEVRREFDRVCSFIKSLGKNSYKSIELGGVEYEVGTHLGSKYPYEILISHRGTLYFISLENCVNNLFRLAMGDKWVEEVDWS